MDSRYREQSPSSLDTGSNGRRGGGVGSKPGHSYNSHRQGHDSDDRGGYHHRDNARHGMRRSAGSSRRGYSDVGAGDRRGRRSYENGGRDGRSRGRDEDRYGHSREGPHNDGDSWTCRECRASNDASRSNCKECGTNCDDRRGSGTKRRGNEQEGYDYYRPDRRQRRSDFHDGGSHYQRDRDRDHDCRRRRYEDDRRSRGRELKDRRRSEGGKDGRESKVLWPPVFEEASASYVFDARSGFFYDAGSDFFYDPKAKLYYGNKAQLYYRHCPDATEGPKFQPVSSNASATDKSASKTENDAGSTEAKTSQIKMSEDGDEADASSSAADGKQSTTTSATTSSLSAKAPDTAGKMKIAISLKSKKGDVTSVVIPTAVASTAATTERAADASVALTQQQKSHVADMEKWNARVQEQRAEMAGKLMKTQKGFFVCILCRRKFPTVDKLRQHERLSALHKSNLAKPTQPQQFEEDKDASLSYRDRASERRVLYGPEASVVAEEEETSQDVPHFGPEVGAAPVSAPEENLGEGNIGNMMLQKLGWKQGSELGRLKQEGEDGASQKLRQDWEKIENIARGGKGG